MPPPHPNLYDPDFDEPRETIEGFTAYRARVGRQLGTERIGVSQWLLPAGQAAYPYHFHLTEEEVLVLLDGARFLVVSTHGAPDVVSTPTRARSVRPSAARTTTG